MIEVRDHFEIRVSPGTVTAVTETRVVKILENAGKTPAEARAIEADILEGRAVIVLKKGCSPGPTEGPFASGRMDYAYGWPK